MGKKFIETLLEFPTEKHVKKVCKPGQGENTCYFLATGANGWSCEKSGDLRRIIEERVDTNTMNAQSDNCDGLLGLIFEHQKDLVGKKVEYEENMPTYISSGTFKNIGVRRDTLFISWNDNGEKNTSINLKDLKITIEDQSIIFEISGVGSFAGKTKIFLD